MSKITSKIMKLDEPIPESFPVAFTDYLSDFAGTKTPLVIDNGSWQFRAGWARDADPRICIPNVASKFKDKASHGETCILVGNEVHTNYFAKPGTRSAFDYDVVVTTDVMEHILDYTFVKFGIHESGRPSIEHPLVITEALGCPPNSRRLVNELLFECYNFPSVCYGIDSAFSLYQNSRDSKGHLSDGIIISSSHFATHILPVLNGKILPDHARRINYGGSQAATFFQRLLTMKYPNFPARVSLSQAHRLINKVGHVSMDYIADLKAYEEDLPKALNDNDIVVQFPFVVQELQEVSLEEREKREQRRQDNAKRLRDQAAKKRDEKLLEKKALRQELTELAIKRADPDERPETSAQMSRLELRNDEDLKLALKKVEADIARIEARIAGLPEPVIEIPQVVPNFDLLHVPDDQLDEEGKKEKKRQKTQKAFMDAREKAKKEKEEAEQKKREQIAADEARRLADPDKWLKENHEARRQVIEKMKARKALKQQLQDRRSIASKDRLRTISTLARDMETNTRRKRKNPEGDDDFGWDDEDWEVYRDIGGDSEEEEEMIQELTRLDEVLLLHDPNFNPDDDLDQDQRAARNSIVYKLMHGDNANYMAQAAITPPTTIEERAEFAQKSAQLHVNVERIRVPEVMFQPSITGLDQAGIIEVIVEMLKWFNPEDRKRLTANIFVTGTNSQWPNLEERIAKDLKALLPIGTPLNVRRAQDVRLDAWRGAAKFARDAELVRQCSLTKAEYQEMGTDYIKEWNMSNRFWRAGASRTR